MKLILFTLSLLCVLLFVVHVQIQKFGIFKDTDTLYEGSLSTTGLSNRTTDTSIFGISVHRIDSVKKAGEQRGGHPASDSSIAMYLRLMDSSRFIGPYLLKYNGQEFEHIEFNQNNLTQIDAVIKESAKGILSVERRMNNKPDYFPLVDQRIEFYNSDNQKLRSFNLRKNNPYRKDKSKKIKEFVFPVPSKTSANLSTSESNWKQFLKNYYAYQHYKVQQNGYVIIQYPLLAIDGSGGILKSISTLLVLDSAGNEISRLNDIETMIRGYYVPTGGKYILCTGGGILGQGFQRLENSSLCIYNLHSKNLIYKEVLEKRDDDFSEMFESEPPIKVMLSFGSYRKEEDLRFTELIFDLNTRTRCIKEFSKEDWKKVTNERIKYSGNKWLQEFDFRCKTF